EEEAVPLFHAPHHRLVVIEVERQLLAGALTILECLVDIAPPDRLGAVGLIREALPIAHLVELLEALLGLLQSGEAPALGFHPSVSFPAMLHRPRLCDACPCSVVDA